MPSLLLAPPPPRPLPRDVFVVKHERTYFAVHREDPEGVSRAGLLAFSERERAKRLSDLIWRHRLATDGWPRRTLGRLEPLLFEDPGGTSHADANPLLIERVALDWLIEAIGKTGGHVDLVEGTGGPEGRLDALSGRTISWEEGGSRRSGRDQAALVLWKRQVFLDAVVKKPAAEGTGERSRWQKGGDGFDPEHES
ncbi:hypothetical protein WJX74_006841 [Apatococcus lobatus]|uniref:Uncharacterized protein n=1 Tax=Apatococcus lobatus TaxID=904363 RepID=A0AAW1SF45_9CHLO